MTSSPFSTLSQFNNLKKLSIRNYAFSIFFFLILFGNCFINHVYSSLTLYVKYNYQNGLPEGTTILPDGTYSIPQNNSQKRTFSKISKHLINRNQIDNKILIGDPISGVPQVVLFTSLNNGDPGIKEPFAVDHDLFKNVKMAVTLILRNDMLRLESQASTIDHVSITSGIVKINDFYFMKIFY